MLSQADRDKLESIRQRLEAVARERVSDFLIEPDGPEYSVSEFFKPSPPKSGPCAPHRR